MFPVTVANGMVHSGIILWIYSRNTACGGGLDVRWKIKGCYAIDPSRDRLVQGPKYSPRAYAKWHLADLGIHILANWKR